MTKCPSENRMRRSKHQTSPLPDHVKQSVGHFANAIHCFLHISLTGMCSNRWVALNSLQTEALSGIDDGFLDVEGGRLIVASGSMLTCPSDCANRISSKLKYLTSPLKGMELQEDPVWLSCATMHFRALPLSGLEVIRDGSSLEALKVFHWIWKARMAIQCASRDGVGPETGGEVADRDGKGGSKKKGGVK